MMVSIQKANIESFLEYHYGDSVNFFYLETNIDVDLFTGIQSRENFNNIRIKKKTYKFRSYLWRLDFSTYETFLPSGHPNLRERDRARCRVYHTLCMEHFIYICSCLRIQIFPNGDTLEDLRLKNRITKNKIQLTEPREIIGIGQNSIVVYRGTYEGMDIAVKKMRGTGDFSRLYKSLWLCNDSKYIVRFFGAEMHDNYCYFAFEFCYKTLRDYVADYFAFSSYSMQWVNIMRYFNHIMGIIFDYLNICKNH